MKQFRFFIIAMALSLSSFTNAHASSAPLNEYNWQMPNTSTPARGQTVSARNMIDEFGNPISANQGGSPSLQTLPICEQNCPGFSSDITECSDGYRLISCPVTGCFQYNKCEPIPCAPGYDTSYKDCPIYVQPDNYLCSKCK